ncbi:MAG TPA: YhjD/YihY/BrkB family envelope integrity protein, partial [Longimicrobiaceae bacterium]
PPPGDGETRPLGAMFRDLSTDASTLIRQEVALAKTEMRRNVRALAGDVANMAVWGVVAAIGGLVLVAFLVTVVGDLLDSYWLGALLVGLLFVAAGAFMAFRSLRHLRTVSVKPENTVETLRDTQAWARAEASGLRASLGGGDGTGPAAAGGSVAAPVNRVAPVQAGGTTRRAEAGSGGGPGGGSRSTKASGPKESLPKRVWAEFKKDDVAGQAAKVAYYFFMSLPPALMAVFALTGIFGGPETAERISAELRTALPGEAAGLVDDFVSQVVMQKKPGLLSIGLLLALWSASNVFSSFADTLNVAYGVEEDRSFVKKKLVALGTMLAVAVLFLAGSTALLAGPKISDALGLGEVGRVVWGVAQWPLAFVLISAAFWIIYYVLPNKDQSGCRKTLFKASMIAAALWLLATLAFRLYVTNFSSYSATYGFIGAIIVLLLWMYVTSMMVLLGGEIASEMEEG